MTLWGGLTSSTARSSLARAVRSAGRVGLARFFSSCFLGTFSGRWRGDPSDLEEERGLKRSPELAWELELEEPEELPLPGRGCSFSTRSHSGRCSTLTPAFLCPTWLLGCDGRGDSRRDSTGDLDVVLTGTLGGTSSLLAWCSDLVWA